ncbi:Oidioi.mRNA.OKI2018_I69.XSR.g14415.t1.cds [Oikopleura dioica]|uniref:Sulfotransferase n=1 Tax=Oikopleura dioica TaxID=34765 RepID=A0ABN7SH07_OIKDI|nr:Oidioi.mRNA.OKI2018_I69.XSR.g14415.t1.cds [Oikopleura dioica]
MQVAGVKRIVFLTFLVGLGFLIIKATKNNEDFLETNLDENSKQRRLPQAICIGAKKCGTGALKDFLSHHPLIATPAAYEMHFFDNIEEYSKGIEFYRSMMPRTQPSQITFEKTPKYMVMPEVPQRVFDMDPNIKSCTQVEATVLTNGLYSIHLDNWLRAGFQKPQILIINGEELIKNPSKAVIEAQEFLNIPVILTSKNFVLDEEKQFFCYRARENEKPSFVDYEIAKLKDELQTTIDKMKRTGFKTSAKKHVVISCPVCLDEYTDERFRVALILCGHEFCDSCVKKLPKTARTRSSGVEATYQECPMCSRKFYQEHVLKLYQHSA